jgi:drug/metabolite transporter (DMT)-like permease
MVLGLVAAPFVPWPGADAWSFLIGSMVIHLAYYALLLRAYDVGDLSHVYPIARGLGPLLVALASGSIVGEALRAREFLGVLMVSAGVVAITFADGWSSGLRSRASLFAALTGVSIAAYTLVDGLGVRAADDALGYIAWLNIIEGPPLIAYALWRRRRAFVPYVIRHGGRSAIGGAIAATGYGIAIWAMGQGMMAHVAALRESSVLFAALIGVMVMGERLGARRIAAAGLIVAGQVLINLRI